MYQGILCLHRQDLVQVITDYLLRQADVVMYPEIREFVLDVKMMLGMSFITYSALNT